MISLKKSSPIFILGAQRSGTTLLRLLVNSHSKIAIPEEGGFWMPLLRKYGSKHGRLLSDHEIKSIIKYIRTSDQFKLWLINADEYFENIIMGNNISFSDFMYGLYHEYAVSQNKDVWGDKTPSFFRMIPEISKIFPNAKFIHIIRDGRDLFLSWRKIDPTKKNISVVALEWLYKVKKANDDLNRFCKDRFISIRYEDLVQDPEKNINEVCKFIGIDYENEMMNYWKKSNQFIGKHHSDLIFRPVSSISTKKWKRELTKKEIRKFETITGSLLTTNDYEIDSSISKSISTYFNILFDLLYGLPYRAAQVLMTRVNYYFSVKFGFELFSPDVGETPEQKKNI